jgi:hypothetical protein
MPTKPIKIGNYFTYGKGTILAQTKIHLTDMYLQAQEDINKAMVEEKMYQQRIKSLKSEIKELQSNQKWLEDLDIGYHDSVEEYFLNLKSKDNGIDVLSGKDYDALKEEHEKLKTLYMKMILN